MSISKERARELITELRIGDLITVDEHGMPVDRAMYTSKVDEDFTVYFATNRNSSKYGQIQANPGVIAIWTTGDGYLSLKGRAVITDEQSVRDYIWEDSYTEYFPGGSSDANYVVIKVTPVSLSHYVCGKLETEEIAL